MNSNINFKSEYLTKHLITYIGNKRSILPFINTATDCVKKKLNKEKVSIFDGFSGSGSVSRLFKYHASELYVNDLEKYSETINRCYLANRSEIPGNEIIDCITWLNLYKFMHKYNDKKYSRFISKNYAPKDDTNIKEKERVFYTVNNAQIIDTIRLLIKYEIEPHYPYLLPFVLAPLLVKASIHNNTSGVFKGFHKKDGIGHFGGAGENALQRIMTDIILEMPIFCEVECPTTIYRGDTTEVAKQLPEIDIAYYDPPYNQHPYGSNYFMLNIINDYNNPNIQDGVSGISKEWNRSDYNNKQQAPEALDELIESTQAKYIMLSYNDEGYISQANFRKILEKYGKVTIKKQDYNTYRGSRNLKNRNTKVKELLWILNKT